MSRPLRIQYPGALYHITCRGNERRAIFSCDVDRQAFLQFLQESLRIYTVVLHSYVLMDNHIHLLVETPQGNVGEFMRRLTVTYTSYFNRANRSVGHLFQGRYKALLVEKDSYLTILTRYIHRNPVRTGTWKDKSSAEKLSFLEGYRWSSLAGYLYASKEVSWVRYDTVLGPAGQQQGRARRQYARDMEMDIREGSDRLTEKPVGGLILGRPLFVEWVREKFLAGKERDREMPTVELLANRDPEEILAAIGSVVGKKRDEVVKTAGPNRMVAMEFLYRRGGMNNREIGELMGLDYSTVSVNRRRLQRRMKDDQKLRQQYAEIERRLSKVKI